MTFNCMIAGVGGQGTVLASKLIAAAAMKRGYNVRTTETIGMAQRGGSVVSHIRVGDDIFSPLIPTGGAHALIAFEPAEAARYLPYLSASGTLIVCDIPVKPAVDLRAAAQYDADAVLDYIKSRVPGAVVVRGRPLKEQCAKTLNVALLGAAERSGIFPFDTEALRESIAEIRHYREQNLISFESGRRIYDEYVRQH